MSKLDYAGDINPLESWELLSKSKDICLIDCRTQAEWQFVGIPNLDSIGTVSYTHLTLPTMFEV